MKRLHLIILTFIISLLFISQSNADYLVSPWTKITESKIISSNLFLITYTSYKDSHSDFYINVNWTSKWPYSSITNQYLSDDWTQYSYQYYENIAWNSIFHMVLNWQDYKMSGPDVLWSLNHKHFVFNSINSNWDNRTLAIDWKEVWQYDHARISEGDVSISNDWKYIIRSTQQDWTLLLDINWTKYSTLYFHSSWFSRDWAHYSFIDFDWKNYFLNIDWKIITWIKEIQNFSFSENGLHYIFSYTIPTSTWLSIWINIDWQTFSESYINVNINTSSISNDWTYRFIASKDEYTISSNINWKITDYKWENKRVLNFNSFYDWKDFFFSFSEWVDNKSLYKLYKSQELLAENVIYINSINKTTEGQTTFYFNKIDNKYYFYYDSKIYGPYDLVIPSQTKWIYSLWVGISPTFIKWKIFPYISSSDKRDVTKWFYSVDTSKKQININWEVSKVFVSSQVEDIYLSEDLSIASYIDWDKLKVIFTSSLLTSSKTVEKTTIQNTSKLPVKIKIDKKTVVNSTTKWTIQKPKLVWIVEDFPLSDKVTPTDWLYPNFEPISRLNESNKLKINWINLDWKSIYLNKVKINWYQSYPYLTKAPIVSEMNESNSFIWYYNIPKDYTITNISVDENSGKDFIIKLDTLNNRFFITPTDNRVLQEMYATDKTKLYQLTIRYKKDPQDKEETITVDWVVEYSYWFNFQRDAFSIYNTDKWVTITSENWQSFENWWFEWISLGDLKLIFPKLDFYLDKKRLWIKELLSNPIYKTKGISSVLIEKDLTYLYNWVELINEDKIKIVKYIKSNLNFTFGWYCLWFWIKWYNYLTKNSPLSEWVWWINSIYSIKKDSQFSWQIRDFNSRVWENLDWQIKLRDLLAKDWLKQKASWYVKTPLDYKDFKKNSVTPIQLDVPNTKDIWHIVLWYSFEEYRNLKNFKISVSSTWISVIYFKNSSLNRTFIKSDCIDYNNNWTLCKDEDVTFIKPTYLARIYVYDNANPKYQVSSIFIYSVDWKELRYVLNDWSKIYWPISSLRKTYWSDTPDFKETIQ